MNALLLAVALAAASAPSTPPATPPASAATAKPPSAEASPPPPGTSPAAAAKPAGTADPLLTLPPSHKLLAGMKGGALRVAVLDTRAAGEVPPRALALFDQSLVPEVRKLEGVSAIGMAEIRDMLGFEYQRQMMGCAADDACLAEIAGALGVDELVTPNLVLNGKTYALSLRRVDLRKARVAQSFERTFEKRDGEELLSIVGPAVEGLFPDRALRAGKQRGVEPALIARVNPPPLPTWAFWATGGAAVAALGAAGVSHYLAVDARSQYDQVVSSALATPTPASELIAAADKVHSRENTRNAFLYTALGFGVAAGVEAFFTDWRGDRRAPARGVAMVPWAAPGSGGVELAGKF